MFTKDKKIKLFECFAGIGCQRMGFEKAKIPYEVVGISEIDKHALTSYMAMHGETKNYGSITDIKGEDLPNIDVLTYSFPCQDISNAGKQRGFEKGKKTRSGLVYEVLRILHERKECGKSMPKVLIMENVKSLVAPKFIDGFNDIQKELESIGYHNKWQILNAKDYGIPQNRERVFMVSYLNPSLDYQFPEKVKLKKCVKDLMEKKVDEKYYINKSFKINDSHGNVIGSVDTQTPFIMQEDNQSQLKIIKKTVCLNSKEGRGGKSGLQSSLQNRIYDSSGVATAITTIPAFQPNYTEFPLVFEKDGQICVRQATKKGYIECERGGVADLSYPNSKLRRGRVQGGGNICPTITATQTGVHKIESICRIRKLTPRECWRLMGISDKYFNKAAEVCSSSQLYKQAGNGIVVDVFAAIVKKLIKKS